MKKNKVKQSIKQEKGAITSYVLLSMLFFLVVISGIYFNTNNKMQKQEKEINKIQQEYQKNNPEEMYVQAQNNSTSVDAPSIQIYDGDILKKEITGEKTNSKKTVYLLSNKVTLKFLSKSINNKYAYSTEENGEKTKLKEDRLDTEVTTSGKTLYVYTINEEGKYSQYYTAVTLILVKVELNPNGGTFTMPTTGTATIKTTVKAENANKIEVTWSDKEEYKEINNNEQVIKTDCTEGKYYLYVRINGEEIFKSQEFNVGQNTLDSNKIKITPNTTNWTNQLTAVIEYGSTLTVNQKAGYGTTLKAAVAAANTSTSSNLTTTANGYFYAEATDTAENKVTASFQITNIDTTVPSSPGIAVTSGTSGNNGYYRSNVVVKITAGSDSQSGVNKTTYILTGSTTKSETTISSGSTITISNEGTTTITAYTYDNVLNRSSAKQLTIKKDATAPTISPEFSEDETRALVRMNVSDNSGLKSIKIGSATVDTKSNKTWVYDYYTSTDGTTTITVTDVAGNTTTRTHKIKFLYTKDNLRTENTGGWNQNYYASQYGAIDNINYNSSGGLFIAAIPTSSGNGRLGTWYTAKPIDLSGYDMLRSVSWLNKDTSYRKRFKWTRYYRSYKTRIIRRCKSCCKFSRCKKAK